MKIRNRKLSYIIAGAATLCLLILIIFKTSGFLAEKEQKEAIRHTESYLAKNYKDMKYEIVSVDSTTDYGHYGYFEHAVTVLNKETDKTFDVYYDKNMEWMEDSIKLAKMEDYLMHMIQPQVEEYTEQHFGGIRYVTASYDMGIGKPLILVKFEQERPDITQKEFNELVAYIKEILDVEHALVIADYWLKELTFKVDF
ncbi:hypothetical protein ACTHOQ_00430 [Solibacillus silvestris]|uniref:hypothetical protein n=1 Tax=Solibacillus silvestris TaxID=76853 RepID=UPI003F7F7BBC